MTTINTQTKNHSPPQPQPLTSHPTPLQPQTPHPPPLQPQPATSVHVQPSQPSSSSPQQSSSNQPSGVQSNINQLCPPPIQPSTSIQPSNHTNSNQPHSQPSISNQTPSPFQYMHSFRYGFNHEKCPYNNKDQIINKYGSIMKVFPTQFDFTDNNKTCLVTILSSKETLHDANNLNELLNIGLSLKLNSSQCEKNSLFCINGPIAIKDIEIPILIRGLNMDNPRLHILDLYILPPKSPNQKTLSFKITVATQKMTNHILQKGFHFIANYINPTQITRSKILNTIQCNKCQNYSHGYNNCKSTKSVCPHCTLDHILKACPFKTNNPLCNNCKGIHRTTSNKCPIRQKFLIIPKTYKDINNQNVFRKNPESSYFAEAPPPSSNPWNNNTNSYQHKSPLLPTPNFPPYYDYQQTTNPTSYPQPPLSNPTPPAVHNSNTLSTTHNINHNSPQTSKASTSTSSPNINYDQILAMATRFKDWPLAFKELQIAFKLNPIIEIPPILHNQLKPDYHTINQIDQSTLPISISPSLPDLTEQPTASPSPPINNPPSASTPKTTSKNNYKNNKNKPLNNPIDLNQETAINNSPTSTHSYPLTPIPKMNNILNSPEADDPAPISQSPPYSLNSSTIHSISSSDIMSNFTIVHKTPTSSPSNINTSSSNSSSPNNSPTSQPQRSSTKKLKLINKTITNNKQYKDDRRSPMEAYTIRKLRRRNPSQKKSTYKTSSPNS